MALLDTKSLAALSAPPQGASALLAQGDPLIDLSTEFFCIVARFTVTGHD
jgi:hypothetical protein